MIDWIHEIDWVLIVMVTIGVFFGTEFGRRRLEAEGEIYSFLPLWKYRVVGIATVLSAGLSLEAAKVAVKIPTAYHVWMLIIAVTGLVIIIGIHAGLEFKLAKRALRKCRAQAG